jgi:hypothetical protein
MKLKAKHAYRNGQLSYAADEEFEVSEAEAKYLLSDAPDCFVEVEDKPEPKPKKKKAAEKPPVDKAVKAKTATKK